MLGSSEKKGLAEKSILLKLIRAFPEQKKASKTKQHINKTEPISDWKFFRLMALYITGAVLAMWGGRTLYMEAMKKFVEEPQAKERKIERGNLAFNKKAAPIFQAEKDTLLEALSSARDSADYPKVEQLLSEYHQNGYKNPLETMIKAIDEHEAQYAIYNPSSSERKKLEQELENAKNRLEALEKDDFKYEIYDQHVTSKSLLDDVYYDAVKSRRVVKLDEKIKEHEANLISDSTLLARYLEPNGIVETHKKIGKLQSRLNNKQMYNDNQFSDNEKAYFVEELLKTHIRNVLQLYTENDDFFLDEELVLEPLPEEAENYLKEINESSQYDKTRLQKKIAAYHLFQSAYVEVLQSYTQYGPMQAKNYVKEGFETVLGDLSEFEGLIQRENPVINTGDINAAKLKQQENDRKKEKVELEKRQQIIKKEVDRLKLNEITDKNFDKKIATNEKTLWVLFYDPLSERALTDINKIAKLNQHFKREGGFDFAVGDIHHNRRTLQKHTKITGIEAQSFPLMLVSENGTVSAESAENVLNYDVPNNSSDSSEKLLLDSLEMPNPPVEIQQDVMGLPEDYNIPELTLVGTDYSGQGAVSIDGNISGIENSAGYIMYEEIFSKLAKLKNKKIITIFWNEQCDERSQFFEALSKVDQSQYFVTSVKLPATPTAIENLKQSQYLAKNVLKITKDVTAIRAPKVVVFDKNGLSTEVISRLEKLNKIFSPSIE